MTSESQPFTIRLPADIHALLQAAAKVSGVSMNALAIEAIRRAVQAKKRDEKFQQRLKESMERNSELLEKLRREGD